MEEEDEETFEVRFDTYLGHFYGFMANLVTAAPSDSLLPKTHIDALFGATNSPHTEYLSSEESGSYRLKALVLIYNALVNQPELRE